jgi:hypothetical protein
VFGVVDLRFKLSAADTLDVTFKGQWRDRATKVVLHVPPVQGLTKVRLNGKEINAKERIELTEF